MAENILSLFDGMSCARIALDQAGINYDNYYASEIDKYAIQVAMKNYPDTIHLGDIASITQDNCPSDIFLLVGGSPCQSLSVAARQKESGLKKGKSVLFWEYIRVLKLAKPKYFILENVASMKNADRDIITKTIGVEPIMINSALVSAQSRKRYYWTNIPGVQQPDDNKTYLRYILDPTLPSCGVGAAIRGRYLVNGKRQDHKMKTAGLTTQRLEIRKDEKSNTLTTVQKDNVVLIYGKGHGYNKGYLRFSDKSPTLTSSSWNNNHFIVIDKKSNIKRSQKKSGCLTAGANSGGNHSDIDIVVFENGAVRRYTPIECERLQTVPDNYTEGVSDTQRYKILGNGFTVKVIQHILSRIKGTDNG